MLTGPTRSPTTQPDRAVILARGLGTRMRERDETARLERHQSDAADRGMKAMIPIGRPFLDYVLSALADADYREACLVIGPEHGSVRDYYTRVAQPRRIRVTFAVQAEPRGTADALLTAEGFASGGCLLVLNGDNYYSASELRRLRDLDGPGTVLYEPDRLVRESNIPAERIHAFAIGTVTPDGYLALLIEKPDEAIVRTLGGDVLVSMNLWRLPPAIFDACRRVQPSARGELELPHAIRDAVTEGLRIRVLRGRTGVLDLSRRSDVAWVTDHLKHVVANP
jgi:dTDP-glucose pyrophosphorylase